MVLQGDGGQLALYNTQHSGPLQGRGYSAGEPATLVAPLAGRLLLFESRLDHEVLPSHGRRWAQAGVWHCCALLCTAWCGVHGEQHGCWLLHWSSSFPVSTAAGLL